MEEPLLLCSWGNLGEVVVQGRVDVRVVARRDKNQSDVDELIKKIACGSLNLREACKLRTESSDI